MTSQLTNAQAALAAAAQVTVLGQTYSREYTLEKAEAFKRWLDNQDDADRDKSEL